jgi:lysocardiolipin and lysophospholipid acyltransferase
MLRFGNLSHEKIILKEPLKKAPLFGWGMQHFNFLFIKRNWDADKSYMQKLLNLYTSREYPLQVFILYISTFVKLKSCYYFLRELI